MGKDIPKSHCVVVHVCNKDGGFMTGVSGWMTFKSNNGTVYGIGFACPYGGATKCKVAKGKRTDTGLAKKAWDQMEDCCNIGVQKHSDYKVTVDLSLVK